MTPVDLSNWNIACGGTDPRFEGSELYRPPTIFNFATPLEALQHLAEGDEHDNCIRNAFEARLKPHPTVTKWKRNRSTLPSVPNFARYRLNSHYDEYHAAARAVATESASQEQQALVDGLEREIGASKVLVPAGQVLFHGRADVSLTSSPSYPSFISTTLIPTVSAYHAKKRGISTRQHPIIYILTAHDDLLAIWGNGGNLDEWELLLGHSLSCVCVARHQGRLFDIVEATIGH